MARYMECQRPRMETGVGLVHSPIGTDRRAELASHVATPWQEALDPPLAGALVDQDAALGQPLAHLGGAESVAHLPAN